MIQSTLLPKRKSNDPNQVLAAPGRACGLRVLATPRVRSQPARPRRAEAPCAAARLGEADARARPGTPQADRRARLLLPLDAPELPDPGPGRRRRVVRGRARADPR